MSVYRGVSFLCYLVAVVALAYVPGSESAFDLSDVPIILGVLVTGVFFQWMHDVITELRSNESDAPSSAPPPREKGA
jgi:riboflavin transporter FmnP